MVTTRRQKATSNRRATRRKQSTAVVYYGKKRKKKLTFQDYDNKLTSLRKKNRVRSTSKATTRASVPIGASNIINNRISTANTQLKKQGPNKEPDPEVEEALNLKKLV